MGAILYWMEAGERQTQRLIPVIHTIESLDGIACRTVEMFEAFGLGQKLIREAYWVNETVFWRPSKQDRTRIERTGRIQDTEDGTVANTYSYQGGTGGTATIANAACPAAYTVT